MALYVPEEQGLSYYLKVRTRPIGPRLNMDWATGPLQTPSNPEPLWLGDDVETREYPLTKVTGLSHCPLSHRPIVFRIKLYNSYHTGITEELKSNKAEKNPHF